MSPQWSVDRDIPWEQFDPAKVDPDLVGLVKAASLVESNACVYADYLCNVFHNDPEFQRLSRDWAEEEVQHGVALGRWARLADPTFDYEARFRRFRAGFSIAVDAEESVRGSRTGELVARCMVEVGTSSYYTAIADATDEPVLKEVCRRIATDEWRHYRMFYKAMKQYLEAEPSSRFRRLVVAAGRAAESEDDELAYAFFAANAPDDAVYERKAATKAYFGRALPLYRPRHIERAMGMIFKAIGFEPHGRVSRVVTRGVTIYMGFRHRRSAAAA